MKNFLLALPLLLLGCTPPPLAPRLEVPLSQRTKITFEVDADRSERRQLLDELDQAERAFLAAVGGTTPPVREIVLWPRATVPRRLHTPELQGKYAGLCRRGWFGARIDLAIGRRAPMAALPHELLHARIGDPDHDDPAFRRLDRIGRRLSLLP